MKPQDSTKQGDSDLYRTNGVQRRIPHSTMNLRPAAFMMQQPGEALLHETPVRVAVPKPSIDGFHDQMHEGLTHLFEEHLPPKPINQRGCWGRFRMCMPLAKIFNERVPPNIILCKLDEALVKSDGGRSPDTMLSLEDPRTTMKSVTAKRATERLTPYEAAVKVGLVGCIEGPPDLALNHRKYARRAVRAKYRRAKRAP